MTALVSMYTKQGFAIGADSLRMDTAGAVVTEEAVKIYEVNHPDFRGAYGFAGQTALHFADSPVVDVLKLAQGINTELLSQQFSSAQEYADAFCSKLASKIQVAIDGIDVGDFGLLGLFSGYSGGIAVSLQMKFPAVGGYLLRPELAELRKEPIDRYCIASGSQVVWDEVMNERVYGPATLNEAIEHVSEYVARCIKNRTDPYCRNIGGKVQIATVSNDGFSWVARP
jgi:hypothetical protein